MHSSCFEHSPESRQEQQKKNMKCSYRISNNKKKKLEKNGKKERKKENTYVYQADTETCDPTIATVWSNFSYVFLHLVNLSLSTKLAVAAMIIDLSSSDFDWMTNKTFWFFYHSKMKLLYFLLATNNWSGWNRLFFGFSRKLVYFKSFELNFIAKALLSFASKFYFPSFCLRLTNKH